MGNNASKQTVRDNRETEKYQYKEEEDNINDNNDIDTLNEKSAISPKTIQAKPVSLPSIENWEVDLLSDRKNLLTINALSKNSIPDVISNGQSLTKDSVDVWNLQVDLEGSPITSQFSSGRCWIFASTNVFRTLYQKKFQLEKFELSQAYLFFYDKLEKANYLLTNIIETSDLKLDSRVVQAILSNGLSDGGQWDMIVNLVTKYGLVPKTIYKDSYHASNTSSLNYVLVNKLKEFALELRSLINSNSTKDEIYKIKDAQIKQIYNILALSLGPPPKPEDKFIWDYKTKDNSVHSLNVSPREFVDLVDLKINDTFSVINDPRNDYYKLYTVDRLNNVVGGKPIDYVNAPSSVQKEIIINSLRDNRPVFFGSDVGKFSDRITGILDTNAFDYDLAFNTKLNLTKAERLEVGSSAMTHAMVISAVHIVDDKIVRYRIENSWGESAGNKGYFVATDSWFDEYVFQVVTYTKYAPKELSEIWKKGDYQVLPIYDPMGALA